MGEAVAADGTRIAYDTFGPADGEPLVMIQGLGADRRGWLLQRLAFGHRYRCMVVDNRGVGASDVPPGPYDLGVMADDVIAAMDDAGWSSAHVMGASMGGVITQIIGVLHPHRTRSLIITCSACRQRPWRVDLLTQWKEEALAGGMRTFAHRHAKWLVGPRSLRRFWPVLSGFGGLALNIEAEAFAAQIDAILAADDDLRFELADVTVPSLVLVGSQDILTPLADSEEIAAHLPGSRLAVIRGAAHGFMFEHARPFNATVGEFIDAVAAEPRHLRAVA